MGRIAKTVDSSPRGKFLACSLPPGYLVKGIGQVDIRIPCPLKDQLADIVIPVRTNKSFRCSIHFP